MSSEAIFIRVEFPEGISKEKLELRYILADTIENRGIGNVIEEGSGEDFIELIVDVEQVENPMEKISSILLSLGLTDFATVKFL